MNGENIENGIAQKRDYLRSEYAASQGLEIQKTYTDINEGYIVSGDSVHLDISITNTTNEALSDISYRDSISKYFHFQNESFITLGTGEKNLRSASR